MQNSLAVIDRLIREHEAIRQKAAGIADLISDEGAVKLLGEIDAANLGRLLELLKSTMQGLETHFNFEESGLLAAAERFDDRRMNTAFSTLFLQHEKLRNDFTSSIRDLTQLLNERPSGRVGQKQARDTLARLNVTISMLKSHAASEDKLLHELKAALEK